MSSSYSTILICLVSFFLFADQNLIAPNMSAIAKYFDFSDTEKDWKLGGELAMGFFLLGAPAGIFIGILTDTLNRMVLLVVIALIGEISCLLVYWCTSYRQLFLLRSLTGISIGGGGPIIFSLIADYFRTTSLIEATMLIGICMSMGDCAGQTFAGLVGERYGWRLPFLVIPIPSITICLIMLLTVPEPRRRESIAPVDNEHLTAVSILPEHMNGKTNIDLKPGNLIDLLLKLKCIFCTPTILILLSMGIPCCIPWAIIKRFLIDYLSVNRGLSTAYATLTLTVYGIGGFIGQFLGGFIGQYVFNRHPRILSYVAGLVAMTGVFPVIYIINGSLECHGVVYSVALLGGILSAMATPTIRFLALTSCTSDSRGTVFSLLNISSDLGNGGGASVVAVLIKSLHSRRIAFNIGMCLWIVCGLLLGLTSLTVTKDLQRAIELSSSHLSSPSGLASNKMEQVSELKSDQELVEYEGCEDARRALKKAPCGKLTTRDTSYCLD